MILTTTGIILLIVGLVLVLPPLMYVFLKCRRNLGPIIEPSDIPWIITITIILIIIFSVL